MMVVIENTDFAPALHVPEKVWFEMHEEQDSCDVLVQTEDGTVFTALFVTLPYLQRQMELSFAFTKQIPHTPATRYATLDTSHILVESLDTSTIEDTIDNLIALDVFESNFIQVTQNQSESTRTTNDSMRTTQELAAVVISDVLVCKG